MAAYRSPKPLVKVRVLQGMPNITPIGEMESLLVWDNTRKLRIEHK